MGVIERINILLTNWRYNNCGDIPDRIFLGRKEYYEVLASDEFMQNFKMKDELFGIKIERVMKDNYLAVGNVIEG